MKVSFCAAVSLTLLSAYPSHAAFITQSQVTNFRFLDAAPGNLAVPEPLRFGAETADKIFLLDLGDYTSADAGQTFTSCEMLQPMRNGRAYAWECKAPPFQIQTACRPCGLVLMN